MPDTLYTAASVRELDRVAIEEQGIPGITLMRRAGSSCFERLMQRWPDTARVTIFCGAGNNGGDGYIVAGLAAQRGLEVQLYQLAPASRLKGDALRAFEWASQFEIGEGPYGPGSVVSGDVVVDALLGTGLSGPVRAPYIEAIAAINGAARPVVAVDIPSGLDADSGSILGSCVRADLTVTFIGVKRGLLTQFGPEMTGSLEYDDLGVPDSVFERMDGAVRLLSIEQFAGVLPRRNRNAHKGHFGHLLVVGGDHGMGGAVALASEAAARVGAGLITVATRPGHVPALIARHPEIMVHGVESRQSLEPLMERFNCVVIGPGLGRSPWSEQMMQLVLAHDLPTVIDADGLNLLADRAFARRDNWMLTPHPGEAARLLRCTNAAIQEDRFGRVEALQSRFGGVVLLKGAGTLIRDTDTTALCPYGNPGMSVGGMGDLLAGVIGGLLAQGVQAGEAVAFGACLHSLAADLVAMEEGERGLMAGDLFPKLRTLVNRQRRVRPGETG